MILFYYKQVYYYYDLKSMILEPKKKPQDQGLLIVSGY